ncbi:MAG TPA: M14 family metallopeptidase [Casimicrobiaceae bacterium]|nr:M14 family metallopeptidase [Casimicrobiaceae bacterium]
MNALPHFAQSYAEAREKFRTAAAARGARMFRHVHPSERGAGGEELSIDLAEMGDERAPDMLLLSSGTHGVEGFCGSGCQVALLHDEEFMAAAERSGVAVLMLHALNPYGFSHLRRANEDNADLNRNFIEFALPLPAAPAYAEIHELLLPGAWPPPADSEARMHAWIRARGEKAFQAAVSGGQYSHPDGLFFGGRHPSWSNACLRAVLRSRVAPRRRLAWIDFHTGLGPRGHGEKIYSGRNDAAALARTKAWWGDDVTSFFDGTSSSAHVTGIISDAAHYECPNAEMTAMALEYGTLPLEHTLQALRAEGWLHNHPDAPADLAQAIKRAMRDAFYIDADDWKHTVCAQAKTACLKAFGALAPAAVSS